MTAGTLVTRTRLPARLRLAPLILLALCGPAAGLATAAGSGDLAQVQRDVEMLARAFFADRPDTVIAFTHPRILAFMGGEAQARQALAASLAAMQAEHVRLESFNFGVPPDLLQGIDNQYAIVPIEYVVAGDRGRLRYHTFYFGIRATGSTQWYYTAGSNISQQNVRRIFPDFPSGYILPQISVNELQASAARR